MAARSAARIDAWVPCTTIDQPGTRDRDHLIDDVRATLERDPRLPHPREVVAPR